MFVIDVGWYLAHYAYLICLNIGDGRRCQPSPFSLDPIVTIASWLRE